MCVDAMEWVTSVDGYSARSAADGSMGHGVKLAGVRLSETGDLAVGGRDEDLALGDGGGGVAGRARPSVRPSCRRDAVNQGAVPIVFGRVTARRQPFGAP